MWTDATCSYNQSDPYLRQVRAEATAYGEATARQPGGIDRLPSGRGPDVQSPYARDTRC